MNESNPRSIHIWLLLLFAIYWAISLDHLTIFPPVTEDEPWLAATSYKLATHAVYGNDLFAGYYGRELHDYNHLPVYLVLQAALFRLAGVGVFQMRFLSVACGLVILPLIFAVGRQVANPRTGLVAVLLLLGQRLSSIEPQTGIPLLDVARIGRYDVMVPVFGLAAFVCFHNAERHHRRQDYVLSGLLVALASMTHLYGAFWLPVLGVTLLAGRGPCWIRYRAPYLLLVGFALPWLPWLAFVAASASDYAGQMRFVASRFDVLNPVFYLDNLRHEAGRWHLGLPGGLLRPGTLLALVTTLPATGWLLLRARTADQRASLTLAMALVIHGFLFTTLLQVKLYNYGIALWPLAVVATAWLGVELWSRAGRQKQPRENNQGKPWWWRAALLGLLTLVLLEGVLSVYRRHATARDTSPYEQFVNRLAAEIPSGSRVLGLHRYWLGLRHLTYRSWLLPVLYTDPLYYHEPLPFDRAIERVAPDVILVDGDMSRYLDEIANRDHPDHNRWLSFIAFLDRHHATLAAEIDDPTYGRVLIYHVEMTPGSSGP